MYSTIDFYNQELKIRNWMETEINLRTFEKPGLLALACACALQHSEWLDDLNHAVYKIAREFF